MCVCVCVPHLPIHSSIDGYLGCFHEVNIGVHAAAAAKLLQSCLTLCNPRDGSPPGSPVGVCVSIQIRVFSGYMPRSKSAGSYMVALFFNLTFCPQFLVNWKSSLGT